jgi:hypothetical protein
MWGRVVQRAESAHRPVISGVQPPTPLVATAQKERLPPKVQNMKQKDAKITTFRHRESNPGLAGAVSVLLMRAANPSH